LRCAWAGGQRLARQMLRQVAQFGAPVGLTLATLARGLQIDQGRQLRIKFVDRQLGRCERAALALNRFGQRVDLGLQHIRCHEA